MAAYVIFILIAIPIVFGDECVINNKNEEKTAEERLTKDLIANADYFSPCRYSPVNVSVQFIFDGIHFDSTEELLLIESTVEFQYNDHRLKWDPKEYDNLLTVTLDAFHFWTPSTTVIDWGNAFSAVNPLSPLIVSNNGDCVYYSTYQDAVNCNTKIKDWPYDVQRCEAYYGNLFESKKEVNLEFSKRALDRTPESGEWSIKDYEQIKVNSNDTDVQLKLIFVLERETETLIAMLVFPAYILTTLTMCSMFLKIGTVRFGLAFFSLLNHLVFLNHLGVLIPKHSYEPPTLLLFYRGSIIITIACLSFSIFLNSLCKRGIKLVPLDKLNDFILLSQAKHFLLWDFRVQNNRETSANILNSALFYIMLLVYFCMFLVLIPKPYRGDENHDSLFILK